MDLKGLQEFCSGGCGCSCLQAVGFLSRVERDTLRRQSGQSTLPRISDKSGLGLDSVIVCRSFWLSHSPHLSRLSARALVMVRVPQRPSTSG